MELIPLFFTALALGLLGGGHCIGMCGGLMGALTMAIPAQQRRGWPLWRGLRGYYRGGGNRHGRGGARLGSIGWLVWGTGAGLLLGALTMAIPAQQRRGWPLWRVLLGYNLGRITSYGIAGALLGSIGWLIQDLGLGPLLRTLAGLLMIAMGLYLANWWSGLTRLE